MAILADRGTGTPVTSGTTWASTTNAVDGATGTTPNTYATWTSSTSAAVGYIEVTGYDFSTILDTSTLNSVTVTLRHAENQTTRISTVTFQPYDGATPIGSAFTATKSSTVRNDSTTFTVTLAQLKSANFKVRATATRAAVTQSSIWSVDHLEVTADYSPLASGRPKIWTGSVWTQKPLKVWTGSVWTEKPVKVWTGSIWKTVT